MPSLGANVMKTRTVLKALAPVFLDLALILVGQTIVTATPGDLDPTFGLGGMIIDAPAYELYDVAIQGDGKIVMVGMANGSFLTARYNVDGSPDDTFGVGGRVSTSFGSEESGATAVRIQTDGKIVVVGWKCPCFDGGSDAFVVIRYNPDGSLDPSFDGDGSATTKVGLWPTAYSVIIQPDGKMIVGGFTWWGDGTYANDAFALAKYNSDGSLDTTFDGDGKVVTEVCGVCNDDLASLALQPDGKIIAVGGSFTFAYPADPVIVRYNVDGSIDTSFNFKASSLGPIGSIGSLTSAATQADGKILITGSGWSGPPLLMRLNSTGSLDTTFDFDGRVTTALAGSHIAIQPDRKIVVAGSFYNGSNSDFKLIRYDPDGSLDPTYGANGGSIVDFDGSRDFVDGIALDPSGRAVVVGRLFNGNIPKGVGIARLLADRAAAISGRVMTPDGRGLRNAVVSLTDQFGVMRTVVTSTFGSYSFDNTLAGAAYTISVTSRRYKFATRTITVTADLSDIDLIGVE